MEVTQQLLAVGFVLCLLGGLNWWVRGGRPGKMKFPGRGSGAGKKLECLERLSLGPQHSIHLIRMGEREIFVAVHGTSLTVLPAAAKDLT